MRYEVTWTFTDSDGWKSSRRKQFYDKDQATRFARRHRDRVNDLLLGGARVDHVRLYAIEEVRNDITERLDIIAD